MGAGAGGGSVRAERQTSTCVSAFTMTSHVDDVSLQALEPSHGLATAAFSLKSP